jgi:spermidine/putrescine ABC transporter ATP-binding subunit
VTAAGPRPRTEPDASPEAADVRLEAVSKRFGDVVAVDAVDLGVRQGELLSLLGPSGCGKTTVLRLIAGFEPPTGGAVWIRGRRVDGLPPAQRNLSMVFQHYALFPHMSVFDNVAFGLRMRRVPRPEIPGRVGDALEMTRLRGLEGRLPRQLSGGQQQRVALARALVGRPSVLLLDEPLGALDKKLREEMQVELRDLQRRVGITTIFVTHDQEEALALSDRVVVMRAGRIVQVGTPKEIYERPRTSFVAGFIGVANFFSGRVVATDGAGRVGLRTEEGLVLPLAPVPGGEAGRAVRLIVRPEKIELRGGGALGLAGRVERLVYLGAATFFDVRLDGGQLVRVQASGHRAGADRHPETGDTVALAWAEEAQWVLRDDGETVTG